MVNEGFISQDFLVLRDALVSSPGLPALWSRSFERTSIQFVRVCPIITTSVSAWLSSKERLNKGCLSSSSRRISFHEVAIKLIPPTLLSPETEQRFQREAQLVAQMDHPAVVPIFDFGKHEGSLFFVMPVVQGTNLRWFEREGALTLGEVLDIGIQVAEALEYSHSRGVTHRDIKPENIRR